MRTFKERETFVQELPAAGKDVESRFTKGDGMFSLSIPPTRATPPSE